MPQFYIDVHADSLSEWDDDGYLLPGPNEAVALARELALGALFNGQRSGASQHASAVIRDEAGVQIATVTIGGLGEVQTMRTTPPQN